VIFHGHDDEVRRLVAACEWGPSGPPLRAAWRRGKLSICRAVPPTPGSPR